MPQPLSIQFPLDPTWEPGVRIELSIDGQTQPDLIRPTLGREGLTLGTQVLGDFMLGATTGQPLGESRLGDGDVGLATPFVEFSTLNRFGAGDYTIRLRTLDAIGNASPWSTPITVAHRPPPDPPRDLPLTANGTALPRARP